MLVNVILFERGILRFMTGVCRLCIVRTRFWSELSVVSSSKVMLFVGDLVILWGDLFVSDCMFNNKCRADINTVGFVVFCLT